MTEKKVTKIETTKKNGGGGHTKNGGQKSAFRIPTWSPTVVLTKPGVA